MDLSMCPGQIEESQCIGCGDEVYVQASSRQIVPVDPQRWGGIAMRGMFAAQVSVEVGVGVRGQRQKGSVYTS